MCVHGQFSNIQSHIVRLCGLINHVICMYIVRIHLFSMVSCSYLLMHVLHVGYHPPTQYTTNRNDSINRVVQQSCNTDCTYSTWIQLSNKLLYTMKVSRQKRFVVFMVHETLNMDLRESMWDSAKVFS